MTYLNIYGFETGISIHHFKIQIQTQNQTSKCNRGIRVLSIVFDLGSQLAIDKYSFLQKKLK